MTSANCSSGIVVSAYRQLLNLGFLLARVIPISLYDEWLSHALIFVMFAYVRLTGGDRATLDRHLLKEVGVHHEYFYSSCGEVVLSHTAPCFRR